MLTKIMDTCIAIFETIFGVFIDVFSNTFTKICDFLKTDKNTFLGVIFSLITVYLVVDRFVEVMLMIFTGIGIHYWSTVEMLIAIVMPFISYLLIIESKYITYKEIKVKIFNIYTIAFIFLALSCIVSQVNSIGWTLFFSAPKYQRVIIEDYRIIRQALSALAIYFPFVLTYYAYIWPAVFIQTNDDILDSIMDAEGITFNTKEKKTGPYSLEMPFGIDSQTGKKVVLGEASRLNHLLIIGKTRNG